MSKQECQAEACAIQACLQKNNYNDARCQAAVRALYTCCDEMYKRGAAEGLTPDQAKSESCPIISVVQRKLKQLDQEG